jgi:2-polyprenyl-3-methyl-5-hydroxy-6-metoxy-1,4-benzoquinol methylase
MEMTRNHHDVLISEQQYFDDDSARLTDKDLLISPDQMRRYREAKIRPTNTPKDTLFTLLLPLSGKNVLEYGCGSGHDSCHLADCGAIVTAFDLSPVSVQKARRRAELLGFADRIQFDVKAAGKLDYAPATFDVIVGIAILHHLHTQLDVIYDEVARLLKPGGVAYFTEPVANSGVMRTLRRIVPVPTHATPDERQLTYADFELMKSHGFAEVNYYHFHGLTRLRRVLGGAGERPLRRADHYAQRLLPFLRRFYGIALIRARKA